MEYLFDVAPGAVVNGVPFEKHHTEFEINVSILKDGLWLNCTLVLYDRINETHCTYTVYQNDIKIGAVSYASTLMVPTGGGIRFGKASDRRNEHIRVQVIAT